MLAEPLPAIKNSESYQKRTTVWQMSIFRKPGLRQQLGF